MSDKAQFRVRAQRFLNGDFEVEDLTRLFLFLREDHRGHEIVRDLGNMIGHPHVRDNGVSVKRIDDLYRVGRFTSAKLANLGAPLDILDMPEGTLETMDVLSRLLPEDIILRDTGFNRLQARTLLRKVSKKFVTKPDGRLRWKAPRLKGKEVDLINCFTSYLINPVAFNVEELCDETFSVMCAHNLVVPEQRAEFDARSVHLTLFAITAMHQVIFRLYDGTTTVARAGWAKDDAGVPHLDVSAAVTIPFREHKNSGFGFTLFATDLSAAEWTTDYDDALKGASWPGPLELTREPRIRPLLVNALS